MMISRDLTYLTFLFFFLLLVFTIMHSCFESSRRRWFSSAILLTILSASSSISPMSIPFAIILSQIDTPRQRSLMYEGSSRSHIGYLAFRASPILVIMGAIQIRKITGDSGDPWGAPKFVFPLTLNNPSHSNSNSLARKNPFTHGIHILPSSDFSSSLITSSSLTFWNPTLMSQKFHPTAPPTAILLWAKITTLSPGSVANLLLSNANWS